MNRQRARTTWRGRAFLAAGVALTLTGLVTSEGQLLRLGVLCLAVPVAGLLLMSATTGGLTVTRTLDRTQVAPGQAAVLSLTVTNTGRMPVAGAMLVQPLTPTVVRAVAGGSATGSEPGSAPGGPSMARRRVAVLRPGGNDTATLALTGTARGHHELPAALLIVGDPFGMVRRTRAATGEARRADRPTVLSVLPVVHRLSGRPAAGSAGAAAIGRGRSLGVAGEQDSAVREYSPGDDVRRIHWRSTAHHGGLMVRQEEQPWQSGLTVVLDTRAAAHAGSPPDSSFEIAVSAAASVLEHAARLGYEVDLVAPTARTADRYLPGAWLTGGRASGARASGRPASGARASGGRASGGRGTAADRNRMAGAAVQALVGIQPLVTSGGSAGRILPPGTALAGGPPAADTVVAVLGSVDDDDLAELADLRAGRTAAIALLVRTADWYRDGGPGREPGGMSLRVRLAALGWSTAELRRGDSLTRAWDQVRTGLGSTGSGSTRLGAGRAGGSRAGTPTGTRAAR